MEAWMHDVPKAVLESQRVLRADVPDRRERFERVSEFIRSEVAVVKAEQAAGGAVPELSYADVAAGRVTQAKQDRIRRRGCVVIRGVYPREVVDAWNQSIVRYIDEVKYLERMHEKAGLDQYFIGLASARPQIYSLFWSKAQMEARQGESLAITRAWLNRLWTHQGEGQVYFDPDRQATYADRVRRREPGDQSLGLSAHSDGGSVERWCEPSFRHLYRDVFQGDPLAFDPFDARDRLGTKEIPSPAVCSAFRTFQGWTALTRQGPGDGTLNLVPIAKTMPYMLLRALQDDVPEGDLCGAKPGRALGAYPAWHQALLEALVPIPVVEAGDTVWWHQDVLHAVEDHHKGQGYSNVIYIGSAPWCAKNEEFLARQSPCFLDGRSSPDFAPENYELNHPERAMVHDLSDLGRRQMGLMPW